jgi:hypothetical protein
MGMSFDDYWTGDIRLALIYREKHYLDIEARNQEMWMQGLYVYDAVATVHYNLNREKRPARNYMEKPMRITPMTEEEEEAERRQQAINERRKFERMMKYWEHQERNGIANR